MIRERDGLAYRLGAGVRAVPGGAWVLSATVGTRPENRERVGEFIQRVGMGNFLEEIGLEPVPEMISHPRSNPYIFFDEELEDEDDE